MFNVRSAITDRLTNMLIKAFPGVGLQPNAHAHLVMLFALKSAVSAEQ
jgi:hypothetical protein